MKKLNFLILFFLLANNVFAQSLVNSVDLITQEKKYDKSNILFEGEVIGDIMKRGDFAWINVNDGQNAIGIWLKKSLTDSIKFTGDFKHIGDRIKVIGVFSKNCPEHGGDLDIHGESLVVINPGKEKQQEIDVEKLKVVKSLTITLIIVVMVWIFKVLKRR